MANVTVTVTVEMNTDNKVSISVNQEPVLVGGVDIGEHIAWEIDASASPGWMFTKDKNGKLTGIDIKDKGKDKFKDKGDPNDPGKHKWARTDQDQKGTKYRYTISVIKGPTTLTWDPSMMND